MSETNGVFRLKSRGQGKIKFSFGEEGGDKPVFLLDPIAFSDEWAQADSTMRDADGKLAKDASGAIPFVAWNQLRHAFLVGYVERACPEAIQDAQLMSQAEVGEFYEMIRSEVEKLRHFFERSSPVLSSSVVNTEVRFAQ